LVGDEPEEGSGDVVVDPGLGVVIVLGGLLDLLTTNEISDGEEKEAGGRLT
jgi:hypothetical protein